jgi:hypothetical protein
VKRFIHIETDDDKTVVITHSLTGGCGKIIIGTEHPQAVLHSVQNLLSALDKIIALDEKRKPRA